MITIDKRVLAIVLILVGGLALVVGRFFLGDTQPISENPEFGNPNNPQVSGEETDPELGSTNDPQGNNPQIPAGPKTRFAGQVIDITTGLPVAEATVAFRNFKGSIPLGHSRTRSGGYFSVEVPEVTQAAVTVRAEGFAPSRWKWEEADLNQGAATSNTPAGELLLAIAPESVLWISVESPELEFTGDILVESRVVEPRTPVEMGAAVPVPPVILDGPTQRLGGLIAGRHMISIRSGSKVLARREIEIGEGEERDLVFWLGPSIQISGSVLRNGQPVEGGTVQTWCRETQASATIPVSEFGQFEARLPSPGSWRFIWTSPTGNGEGTTLEQELFSDSEVVLTLNTGRIEGRVMGPIGESVVGLQGSL
ncbi:MAG: carboxypeptidase-like regulatory domain-containing protein, partial [Planctomycetota bacterium]